MELNIYKAISRISAVLQSDVPPPQSLEELGAIIVSVLQYPQAAQICITLGTLTYHTPGFRKTPWILERTFSTLRNGRGSIVIAYEKEMSWKDTTPFLPEEEDFLEHIANHISGAAYKNAFDDLNHDYVERKKELSGISSVLGILQKSEPIEVLLQEVADILPAAWQYPEHAAACIKYGGCSYASAGFSRTPWLQTTVFSDPQGLLGTVEVCYQKQFADSDEGPFLKEERSLIDNVAQLLTTAVGSKLYERLVVQNKERLKELYAINQTTQIIGRGGSIDQTLQSIVHMLPGSWLFPDDAVARITFGKDEYVTRDFSETPRVMREPFITFDNCVGTIEVFYLSEHPTAEEGPFLKEERDLIRNIARLIAHFINNYKGRNLVEKSSLSRMQGSKSTHPVPECRKPIIKLLNTHAYEQQKIRSIRKHRVHQVLLVASSFDAFSIYFDDPYFERHYYSPFNSVLELPRITLVCSWAHASELLSKEGYDLVVIIPGPNEENIKSVAQECLQALPDLPVFVLLNQQRQLLTGGDSFLHGNPHQRLFVWPGDARIFFAMVMLLEDMMNVDADTATGLVPIVLIVEDSPDYYSRLLSVLYPFLFLETGESVLRGASQFHNATARAVRPKIVLAHNYESAMHAANTYARSLICLVSDVEFEHQGSLNKKAGITLAQSIKTLRPDLPCLLQSSEESNVSEVDQSEISFVVKGGPGSINAVLDFVKQALALDKTALDAITTSRDIFSIRPYNEKTTVLAPGMVVTLCDGSLGGKGRGAAFLSTLIHETPSHTFPAGLVVQTPITALIGANESARVFALPAIKAILKSGAPYPEIRKALAAASLGTVLKKQLRSLVKQIRTPLAVRSSGLFEDSVSRPFAGAFETYLLPNNHPDAAVRARQLEQAILLVYASLFRPEAQSYFDLAGRKPQEELMAVVIQETVGTAFGTAYYPHISGVARSYNYYPIGEMKPDEGVVLAAVGLGAYVVDGHPAYRFSPKYPAIDFGSIKNLLAASQTSFLAVDLTNSEPDLVGGGEKAGIITLDIRDAEKAGALRHCASAYDAANDRIVPGLSVPGPRIVDFADILKYDYIPLAQSLDTMLGLLTESFGAPVEMEWAVTLPDTRDSPAILHLLQVRPLIGDTRSCDVSSGDPANVLLYSKTAMGNGCIGSLHDVVIVNRERFDRLKTEDMVAEVDYFNRKMIKEKKEYVLIGPGRWGTRDPSLGIPVMWSNISAARILIEVSFADFPVEASLGSHFFHNLTAMNRGYIAIRESGGPDSMDWNAFSQAEVVESQTYFKHIRFTRPLTARLDGKKSIGTISKE